MASPAGHPRTHRKWRELRERVYAEETHCWICKRYVDQTLPPRTRWSRSVDHVIPLAQGGAEFDRANVRLAHFGHNSARGARAHVIEATGATHNW